MKKMRDFSELQSQVGDFGRYQCFLLLTTQLVYVSITGTILSTTFDTILPQRSCNSSNTSTDIIAKEPDFRSLLMAYGFTCDETYIPTLMGTTMMVGGAVGSAFFGYFADNFGRKYVVLATLLAVAGLNFVFAASADRSLYWAWTILAFLGFFSGGHLVTNLILTMEIVGSSFWRMGVSCLNGWPLGMMGMALIGYLSRDWRLYHALIGCYALPFVVILAIFGHESPRWLIQKGKYGAAKKILAQIAKMNHKPPLNAERLQRYAPDKLSRRYGYFDLLKNRMVFRRLFALLVSHASSATISYCVYFGIKDLAGNRYLNLFVLALLKLLLGLLPWPATACNVGRRPIFLISVAIACAALGVNVAVQLMTDKKQWWLATGSVIVAAAAVDPIWKINHVYSVELFPTTVRSMSRAAANLATRVGSVVGPQVAFLAHFHSAYPPLLLAGLASVHFLVGVLCLPETARSVLPDQVVQLTKETDRVVELDPEGKATVEPLLTIEN